MDHSNIDYIFNCHEKTNSDYYCNVNSDLM